jgi:large subunit ribosomal protein L10
MARPEKIKQVDELKAKFAKSGDFIIAEYRGLTVDQISSLRRKLRETGVTFKVVKNNLALIALRDIGIQEAEQYFTGPTSVAFAGSEAPSTAKALLEYQGKTKLQVRAAYVGGRFFGAEETKDLSMLPSRSVLLSQVAGAMISVLSTFAGDMQSVLSTFALSIKALEEKKAAQG